MFRTEYYKLRSEKIKSPVKVVMLADLHNYEYGEHNEILLKAIREISPDFICLAGDMLVGHSKISFEPAQRTVKILSEDYPVFYGLGNHESRMKHDRNIYKDRYETYMEPLKKAGVQVLADEKAKLRIGENKFCIYGYDLPEKYFEKFNKYPFKKEDIEASLGNCEMAKDCYNILLAHNPVYFPQYAAWGADLTLSGHLHGGIIRLPFLGGLITPQAKLFPKYSAGNYHIGKKELIVSRGLGTHTIPVRFHNPPELSVICLGPAE